MTCSFVRLCATAEAAPRHRRRATVISGIFMALEIDSSVCQGFHQASETRDLLFDLRQTYRMPDVRLTACDYRFADLSFKKFNIRNRWPTRAGDEDTVGLGCFF